MTQELTQDDIKTHIIHRNENLLLDTISIPNTNTQAGNLSLTVHEKDPLNRSIFLKKHQDNALVLQPALFMEILALASIVVSGKLKNDEMVMFAAISNFKKTGHANASIKLTGNVKRINAKHNFLKYEGNILQNQKEIATGEMTAIFTTKNHTNTPETSAFIIPTEPSVQITKENRHKSKEMILIDALYKTQTDIISRYKYPSEHPLTKGHFPNNPIMMGVMQWMSIEDTLCAYLEQKNEIGHKKWQCNATIYNQHSHKIAEIKSITLESWINEPNILNQTEIQATKRINFRNMVKPNDTIYTVITNLEKL